MRNKQIEMLISFLHLHGDEESFDNTAPNYQHFRLMLINMAYYKQSDRRSSLQSSAVQESKDCIVQFTAEAKAMLHGKDICDLFKHAELSFIILACRQSAVRLLLGKGGMDVTPQEFQDAYGKDDISHAGMKKLHAKKELGFGQDEMDFCHETLFINASQFLRTQRSLSLNRRSCKILFQSVLR
ncbi:MAG: hypothetical protein ACREOZ_01520, partial [Gloeomargaritales cyanobacterium]